MDNSPPQRADPVPDKLEEATMQRKPEASRTIAHPSHLPPFRSTTLCQIVLLTIGIAAGLGLHQTAVAQATSHAAAVPTWQFNIPATDLGTALLRAGQTAGLSIGFDPQRVQNIRSPSLQGRYSAQQALDALLAGSGWQATQEDTNQYTLTQAPRPVRQSPPANPEPETLDTLDEVVIVAPVEREQLTKDQTFQAPLSTSVLTRDDIERFRGTTVGDIFKGMSGVLVGENRNSGGLDVNVRGMQGQGRVPILVDGARQETTVGRGYAGVASRSYIDPDLIGGIQVDKGPVMSAQGTGATGGLVTMRTLDAEDIVKPGKTFGIRARGTAIGNHKGSSSDSYNTAAGLFVRPNLGDWAQYRTDCAPGYESQCSGRYDLASVTGESGDGTLDRPGMLNPQSYAGSIAIAKRLEMIDLVGAYATRRQGNYYAGEHGPSAYLDTSNRSPGDFGLWTDVRAERGGVTPFRAGERITNTNYESNSMLLKAKLYLPAEQELTLSWMRYDSTYGEMMPFQLLAGDFPRQTAGSTVTANTYTSRYRWNPMGNDSIDLRANLWHTDTQSRNRNYSGLLLSNPFTFGADAEQHYKRTGFDLSNTSAFNAWGRSEVRYGVAASTENIQSEANERGYRSRDGKRTEYSAFAAIQYQPVPSLTFDGGIRYSRYSALDKNSTTVCTEEFDPDVADLGYQGYNCETFNLGKIRNSGSAPIASLTWEPMRGWQIYGRYAEALRMPSLFETSGGFALASRVGSNLRPEHARNREVGMNYLKDGVLQSNDKLRLKLAYFRNHTSDYLTRTGANVGEQQSRGFVMRNIESADFHGLELSGSYDLDSVFSEFSATKYNKIEVCHTGSYRRARCTDFGIASGYINNMIPPNWHASLTLGTRLLERKLTLGVRGTLMGKRTPVPQYDDENVNSAFSYPVPWHAYRVYDLFASYKVNDSVSVDFNIDNFTDRYYLDALGLGLVPSPGRTAKLSVTLQF